MTTPATLSQHNARVRSALQRGRDAAIEVGQALIDLKNDLAHGDFLPYCADHFELSRQRVKQFTDLAEMSTMVDISNERQARELAPLLKESPELIPLAVELAQTLATEQGRTAPIAKDFAAAVDEIRPVVAAVGSALTKATAPHIPQPKPPKAGSIAAYVASLGTLATEMLRWSVEGASEDDLYDLMLVIITVRGQLDQLEVAITNQEDGDTSDE